jgi:hypothetical protein
MRRLPPEEQPYLRWLAQLAGIREVHVIGREPRVVGGRWQPDFVVRVQTDAGQAEFMVEVKNTHLDRGAVKGLLGTLGPTAGRWILFAPYVGRPLGETMRRAGLNYVDLNGNAFLRVGNRYVAHVEGRRAAARTGRPRGVRAAGTQALFALLAREDLLPLPLRQIAVQAGTNPQTVLATVRRLEEAGAVRRAGRQRKWLHDGRRRALDLWLGDYGTVLRPTIYLGRYRTVERDPQAFDERLEGTLGAGARMWLGGVAAGFRIVPHYRGPETTLHVQGDPHACARTLRALPDPEGPLHLLRVPGPLAEAGLTPDTVHPLLVYAEMLQTDDDRAAEAAELVKRRALPEFA